VKNPFLKHDPEQSEFRANQLAHNFYAYLIHHMKLRGVKPLYLPDEETFEKAMDLSLISVRNKHGPIIRFIDMIMCFEKFVEFLLEFQKDGAHPNSAKAAIMEQMKKTLKEIIGQN